MYCSYLLMCVAILFAVVNSCLLRGLTARREKDRGSPFLFNAGVSAVWAVLLSIPVLFLHESISLTAVLFGLTYGGILFLFLLFKTLALAEGPISQTTLIGSCAFVIPAWFGVLYAKEPIYWYQLTGMILLLASLFFCMNKNKGSQKLTWRWAFACLGFFFAGGLVGILYKLFGCSGAAGEINSMMLVASGTSALLFVGGAFLQGVILKTMPVLPKGVLLPVLFCGLTSCVYIWLNIHLASRIPSAVFFPVSNGALVMLSTWTGSRFFHEKLTRLQKVGIVIGLCGIAINGFGCLLP